MKAYELDGSGKIDNIVIRERAMPKPGPREVLVRMRAASLNYRDLMILRSQYLAGGKAGQVPLSDGVGEVIEAGEGVSLVTIGDRVMGTFFPRWLGGAISAASIRDQPGSVRDGMLAEYVVFHEDAVVNIPSHMSFEEASTLPCAAQTAWVSLNGPRPLLAGETVLTQGSGGVSVFALQIAKLFGARVIATTSDDNKAARLIELGADEVINYRKNSDWPVIVRQLTGKTGADHIIEVGGAGTLEKSLRASSVGAVVNLIGVLEDVEKIDGSIFMRGIATIRRISVGSRADLEAMSRALTFHKFKPVIDRIFSFEEAREAYRHFDSRNFIGKVVISIP